MTAACTSAPRTESTISNGRLRRDRRSGGQSGARRDGDDGGPGAAERGQSRRREGGALLRTEIATGADNRLVGSRGD